MEVVRQIARNEGPLGFYRGFGTVILGMMPMRFIYMAVLEVTKAGTMQVGQRMSSGCSAQQFMTAVGGYCGGCIRERRARNMGVSLVVQCACPSRGQFGKPLPGVCTLDRTSSFWCTTSLGFLPLTSHLSSPVLQLWCLNR